MRNAIKFTPHRGNIDIKARFRSGNEAPMNSKFKALSGDMLEVSVKDDGVGIRQQDIKRLFKHNGFIKPARRDSESGIGLGLYICR